MVKSTGNTICVIPLDNVMNLFVFAFPFPDTNWDMKITKEYVSYVVS